MPQKEGPASVARPLFMRETHSEQASEICTLELAQGFMTRDPSTRFLWADIGPVGGPYIEKKTHSREPALRSGKLVVWSV